MDLWFLVIPGALVTFVVFVILNSIFNIKIPADGRPIVRAPAGSSDGTDSSFSGTTDLSNYPGTDSSPPESSSDSNSSSSADGDSGGSSGGGDGGGGGGGD